MTQYLILCPTLTWAQRAQRLLERAGLNASVVTPSPGLAYTRLVGNKTFSGSLRIT